MVDGLRSQRTNFTLEGIHKVGVWTSKPLSRAAKHCNSTRNGRLDHQIIVIVLYWRLEQKTFVNSTRNGGLDLQLIVIVLASRAANP